MYEMCTLENQRRFLENINFANFERPPFPIKEKNFEKIFQMFESHVNYST